MTFPEAPVLPGPWRLREGVVRAVLPLKDLRINGVAHIELTSMRQQTFTSGGFYDKWLETILDGESVKTSTPGSLLFSIKKIYPEALLENIANVKRIEWEENGWHYDIGIATKDTYLDFAAVGPEHRNREDQDFMITIPFPIHFQGPTVCIPWAGEFAGQPVQAPLGYATIFDHRRVFHRGDRWSGSLRGLYFQGVTLK